MKLALMTRPDFFIEESQILTALFDEGLQLLHIRKPGSEPVLCERLLQLLPESSRRLTVTHDHFYLKAEYGLRGIHLNQRNPQLPDAYKGSVSCTCYTAADTEQRRRQVDYVFYQPSPADPQPTQPPARNVFYAGAVTLDNVGALRDQGYAGAVVFADVWNRFNIFRTADYRGLVSHFRQLLNAAE